MNKRTAIVLSNTEIAARTRKLVLQPLDSFSFLPGQFVTIQIPTEDGKILGRAYSIASLSTETNIVLLIRIIPNGLGSAYVNNLQQGDEVSFFGPVGRFVLSDLPLDYLFIGTGVGVVPFIPMIDKLLTENTKQQITLLQGFRYEEDIFDKGFFQEWEKKYSNFNCICTVSRPSESWKGKKGRVTDHLLASSELLQNRQIYICGNGGMVQDVTTIALEQGVAKEHVFFEKYNNI